MKKLLVAGGLTLIFVLFFTRCYLNKFIYTDAELEEHYKELSVKPTYKQTTFLNHRSHYAVFSKSDTLPLLVLVHGAPGAWYGYMNLTDDSLLQANFKIVSVDRLGYGKSGYGKEVLSTELQAKAIKNIIDVENTAGKKVYLLGRSYGAPIGGWLSIHYPETFEKLLMISPVIDPEKEKFYWFSNIGKSKLMQWLLPDMLNVATKEKFSHPYEMQLMKQDWKKLQIPTYVLIGEDDRVADTANFSFAKTHITSCEAVFIKLKATGHLVTVQQPELVKQMLLDSTNCRALQINNRNLCAEISEQHPDAYETLTAENKPGSSTSLDNRVLEP